MSQQPPPVEAYIQQGVGRGLSERHPPIANRIASDKEAVADFVKRPLAAGH